MNKLFSNLFISFMMIIVLIIVIMMVSFTLIYSRSYEEQVVTDNDKQAFFIAQSLYSFMHTAYKTVEELSHSSDVLSMDTERQTAVFKSTIERNDYFELLYAQGMDGMQTGRSTGELGNRKERWWFIQMEQTQKPFISESYYSVGTNMPCASVFFPMINPADEGRSEMIGIMAGDIKLSALHDLVAENADIDGGTWAFILDGRGVVVAHPDSTYQEELYNYREMTRTVTVKDENGVPIQDAAGNITEELSFEIPLEYKDAIADMMLGHSGNARFEENGGTIYLSYRPVEMDGYSDPWYVLSVKDGEVAMRTRNTVIFLIVVSSVIIIVGAVLVVLFAARNISSRVKFEAMQAKYEKDKAQASERAKGEFLAAMSHEIRTPLNAILGITQIQLMNDDMPHEYAESFAKINNSGNILLGLINDILDMSKIETGKLELHPAVYDMPSLINDAVQLNIVRIGSKPIEFILSVDENLPSKLYGDEMRLKQILSNLLSNAFKYTSEGRVELSVSIGKTPHSTLHTPHSSNQGLEVRDQQEDEIYLVFSVSDTGQGMKEEDRKLLFTEYKRFNAEANRTTEGTGLGLSITKRIVELMDGTIEVDSEYGVGSVFTVTVPQTVTDKTPIGAQTAESFRGLAYTDSRFRERRKTVRNPMPYGKVLVVDDSASNLYVAVGLLSPYKLDIDTAESGFEAIEKIKGGVVYDIIFMDHMMPQMDGIETTAKLRETGYKGVIVALTANALVGNDTMFEENGFDGFISKPIDTRRLDGILNTFIRDKHPEESMENKEEIVEEPPKPSIPPELISIFCDEASNAAKTLRKTYASGDIKLFTSTAHAMKSVLGSIGQDELSAKAKALEKAGNDGDSAYIEANYDAFAGELEGLVSELRIDNGELKISNEKLGIRNEELGIRNEELGISDEDITFLSEQLEMVKEACEGYDDAAALGVLDALREKKWDIDTTAALKKIRNAIYLDSDFEKAIEIINKII